MRLRRDQLGIVGDRGSGIGFRIELPVREVSGRMVPYPLHEETVGSLARVYGGQLRQGNFRLPIAIKLQRDLPLTREQNESVVAKFDTERTIYLRIHAKNSTVKAETPNCAILRFGSCRQRYDVP